MYYISSDGKKKRVVGHATLPTLSGALKSHLQKIPGSPDLGTLKLRKGWSGSWSLVDDLILGIDAYLENKWLFLCAQQLNTRLPEKPQLKIFRVSD